MTNKILIIDDDPVSLTLLQSRLTANGYEVATATNGNQALVKIKQSKPDLILTDVLMPEMDGFSFYKEVKSNEATSRIPIIVMTARSKMRDTFEMVGADSFLAKPVDINALLAQVQRLTGYQPLKPVLKTEEPPLPAPAEAKIPPEVTTQVSGKKALIFGSSDEVLKDISQQLQRGAYNVVVVKDAEKIVGEAENCGPDLILLQANAATATPLDEIVVRVNLVLKKKINQQEKKNKKEEDAPVNPASIVLFTVEEEMSAVSSMAEKATDVESIIQRCKDNSGVSNFGMYSPISFFSRIQKFLK